MMEYLNKRNQIDQTVLVKHIENINSTKLIKWNRWDILAKYYYAYLYLIYNGKPPEWAIELYYNHILVLNGGKEETTYFQPQGKSGFEAFITGFHVLMDNITKNGFDKQYPIPITSNDSILNGGHRIAISAILGLNIPVNIIEHSNISLNFTSFCFQDRTKYKIQMPVVPPQYTTYVKNSLQIWENDTIALNLLVHKPEHYRMVIFFDESNFKVKYDEITAFLTKNNTNIVYLKNVVFTQTGIYKLTQHLYHYEKHVNINWKTNQIYKINATKNKYNSVVGILYSNDLEIIKYLSQSNGTLKKELRNIMGNHHQIHITDNIMDTIISARLLLHQPSIDFVNKAIVNGFNETHQQLNVYQKYLQNLYKLQVNNSHMKKNKHDENIIRDNLICRQNYFQFQDMFCLVSSYILSLYGLRRGRDIDFICDYSMISDILHYRIDKISHNKYSAFYKDSIKQMIHHPKSHFYYLGWKCLSMDGVSQMKEKRYELPKDVDDLKIIKQFNNFAYLKHMVTIITVTHIVPSAPSTRIIENMISSLHQHVEGSQYMNHLIFVDNNLVDNNPNKEQYINNLNKLRNQYPNLFIIDMPNSGLKTNYINGIKISTTPYLYFIEHDCFFLENIPTTRFVTIMESNANINYIKLSKRNNMETGGWDRKLEQDKNFNDIVKTDSWTNHSHIVRRTKWVQDWLHIINPKKKAVNAHGVEEVLYTKYQEDIKQNTFKKAHHKWGCYNWLTETGKSCIKHIDDNEHYDEH
jgi:hypothetical protein